MYLRHTGWSLDGMVVSIPPNPDNIISATVIREVIKLPRTFSIHPIFRTTLTSVSHPQNSLKSFHTLKWHDNLCIYCFTPPFTYFEHYFTKLVFYPNISKPSFRAVCVCHLFVYDGQADRIPKIQTSLHTLRAFYGCNCAQV